MMAGMYAAISGLDAQQAMLNDTANNLANVNTVGFKASEVTFATPLTQVMRGGRPAQPSPTAATTWFRSDSACRSTRPATK